MHIFSVFLVLFFPLLSSLADEVVRGFSVDSLSEGSSPRPEVLKLIALNIKVHESSVVESLIGGGSGSNSSNNNSP